MDPQQESMECAKIAALPHPPRHSPADASPAAIAAAAVAAGEACGALPPLDGSQRTAVQSFFARTAEALLGDQGGAQSQLDFEALGAS